jgi:hypothetical protein
LWESDLPEPVRNSGLRHYAVGRVPGQNFRIHWKMLFGERTVPNLVIAFTLADRPAAVGEQNPFDLRRKTRHQA